MVESLTEITEGLWQVTTIAGTQYLLDLDVGMMIRRRNPDVDPERSSSIRLDDQPTRLLVVERCEVGSDMSLLMKLRQQNSALSRRTSTLVVRIERVTLPPDTSPWA
jgi:BMFP domain-containing protein YqiC